MLSKFVLSGSGMTAPQAAGVIHSDFEKGFIRAETVSIIINFVDSILYIFRFLSSHPFSSEWLAGSIFFFAICFSPVFFVENIV